MKTSEKKRERKRKGEREKEKERERKRGREKTAWENACAIKNKKSHKAKAEFGLNA